MATVVVKLYDGERFFKKEISHNCIDSLEDVRSDSGFIKRLESEHDAFALEWWIKEGEGV